MRLILAMVLVGLVALPLNVSAQADDEGKAAEPSGEQPAQPTQPTPSRLERWHPEAFVDPSKPASEPALKLDVDSTALEVTPTGPPPLYELERQEEEKKRRRRLGLGIGLGVGLVVVGVLVMAAVAVPALNDIGQPGRGGGGG